MCCKALPGQKTGSKPLDLFFTFCCPALDVITDLCFGKDLYAVDVPNFQTPVVVALHNLTPAFTSFRHFSLLHNIISSMLPNMSVMMNPEGASEGVDRRPRQQSQQP